MEKQIYYHDSDAGGVVYYANYLKYMEEARIDLFRQKGLSESNVNGQQVFFPVRQCNISYHKPAYYGEKIECNAVVTKITPARIIFHQEVKNTETGELLVEAEITLACVSAATFKPQKISPDIKSLFCAE